MIVVILPDAGNPYLVEKSTTMTWLRENGFDVDAWEW